VAQKTHPIGFRLGIVKDWHARWFAHKQADYRKLVLEDLKIRNKISENYPEAGISKVDIERGSSDVIITIHTARPGIVIGRGGQRVEQLRKELEGLTDRRARLNVQEIRQPELDAYLVGRNIADQLERRIAFRRAIRQSVTRTMQAGAQGIKVICGGRLGGADIARTEKVLEGRVPLHTLRADIDYGLAEAATEFGRIGVRVWIYKGDILPDLPPEPEPEEEIPAIEVTLRAEHEQPVAAAVPPVAPPMAPPPAQAVPPVAPPAAPVQPAAPVVPPVAPPPAQVVPAVAPPVAPVQPAAPVVPPVATPPAQVVPAVAPPAAPVQPATPAVPPALPPVAQPPAEAPPVTPTEPQQQTKADDDAPTQTS
jgi:small subunit ribosomal protein S3